MKKQIGIVIIILLALGLFFPLINLPEPLSVQAQTPTNSPSTIWRESLTAMESR